MLTQYLLTARVWIGQPHTAMVRDRFESALSVLAPHALYSGA
jgi:hypothetical protein